MDVNNVSHKTIVFFMQALVMQFFGFLFNVHQEGAVINEFHFVFFQCFLPITICRQAIELSESICVDLLD